VLVIGECVQVEFHSWDDKFELSFVLIIDGYVWLFSDCWSVRRNSMMFTPAVRTSVAWLVIVSEENEVHSGGP
jgi:hypothetical protein